MVSDAVVCARGPVAVRPSSGVLIWCRHEAELCSIVCSSWTAGEASTRQGAGECIHAVVQQPVEDTALWFMFEVTDFKCHVH